MSTDAFDGLKPLNDPDWPAELEDLREEFFGRANVYRVMAHHPQLLRAWTGLRQHIVLDTALGRERSELVILRAAANTGSPYEWSHHVVRARSVGISDARIAAMKGDVDGIAQKDRLIAEAVDQLMATSRIAPETLKELHAQIGSEGLLDLMATVGFYSTLAFILNSFGTEIDGDILAALEETPLSV